VLCCLFEVLGYLVCSYYGICYSESITTLVLCLLIVDLLLHLRKKHWQLNVPVVAVVAAGREELINEI
jgi:hypothetical protein